MTAASPRHDLIVFGATSFVGKILTRHLLKQFGPCGDLKWAAAGRLLARLEELRASLGPEAAKLPLVVADAADEAALRQMCARTRAVVSTVGPYALYGEPLVRVCAETGTDYCDLTGEAQWIRRMLSQYEEMAHSVILAQSNESYEREKTDIRALFNSRVDGLLMSISRETKNFDHIESVIAKGVPVVFYDRSYNPVQCSNVVVDDYVGAKEAVNHLIEQGYRKIAFLEGSPGLVITNDRKRGYQDALREHHLEVKPAYVQECVTGSLE